MKNITPIIAILTINEEPTTFAALSVNELYDSLQAYAKETEDQWVEWMAALPLEKDVQAAVETQKGTANSIVIKDHTIGDWDEYIQIELMPQQWVDRLISPFVSGVRLLATEMTSMIGHPENPFAENILDDLTEDAFKLIKEDRPAFTDYESDDI